MKNIKLITRLGLATACLSTIPLTSCHKLKATFENDTWENICRYANEGLDSLKSHYKIDNFIGLTRQVKINGLNHTVRVIGVNHDTVSSTDKTATLTFELVNLLSDSTGTAIKSDWMKEDAEALNNYDYNATSTLYVNLNNEGTQANKTWTKTAIEMLADANTGTPEVANNIKTVTKSVAKYERENGTYVEKTYDTKLFPLTMKEMGQTHEEESKWIEEGNAYTYWALHSSTEELVKADLQNNASYYWLVTPSTEFTNDAFNIFDTGEIDTSNIDYQFGVSFAFCI